MFRGSGFKLATMFGIPVMIHPTWFIIWLLFSLSLSNVLLAESGVPAAIAYPLGALTALVVFATLLAHEFGHALMAKRFGIGTERITLFILGGVAQIREEPRRPIEELLIALAGPAVSIACMLLFGVPWLLLEGTGAPAWLLFSLQSVATLNFIFAAFNMIPGFPMDGGRVLRALVWFGTDDYLASTRYASWGGQAFGIFLIVMGFFLLFTGSFQGFMPILLGFFLVQLAKTSYRQAQLKSAFDSVRVRDLMRPVQVVVPADLPIRSVVQDYIYKIHADRFPVVRGSSLLGYISADAISGVDRTQWDSVNAERLAQPYLRTEILSPNQSAIQAFQQVNRSGQPNLPVFNGRQLIGFLFVQDVANYLHGFSGIKRIPF